MRSSTQTGSNTDAIDMSNRLVTKTMTAIAISNLSARMKRRPSRSCSTYDAATDSASRSRTGSAERGIR